MRARKTPENQISAPTYKWVYVVYVFLAYSSPHNHVFLTIHSIAVSIKLNSLIYRDPHDKAARIYSTSLTDYLVCLHHHRWLYSPCKDLWLAHTGGFVILLGHSAGLLWTSDQPVAKVSTYTGQHNTGTHTSMPWAGFEPTTPVASRKTYALDRAAFGTSSLFSRCL
jgi:hypothetical protein